MIQKQVNDYVASLIPERDALLTEMEQYAGEHRIPIMELVGIEAVLQLLRLTSPSVILEIGTAIGYSAIRMAQAVPNAKVVTVERDKDRYELALSYIQRAGLSERIEVLFGDALEIAEKITDTYTFDVIFIDAAKGQYSRFFDNYTKALNPGGMVISDNVLFKGFVAESQVDNKRIKGMVEKLKQYNHWLMNHPDYDTTILPVGDGIAISKKR